MAETTNIPSDMLAPGDVVDVKYEIVSTNQAMIDLAVQEIKKTLYSDGRFDYWGSKIITVGDEQLQRDVQFLTVTLAVRKYVRGSRQPDGIQGGYPTWDTAGGLSGAQEPQEGLIGYIAIAILVGLAMGAAAAYSGAVIYKSYTIRRIAESSTASDSTKAAAINALGKPMLGFKDTILGLGAGGLIVAGLVLWAILRRSGRSSPASFE